MSSANTMWAPPPEPKTGLGRYRVLSSRAGVRVSPIQLGMHYLLLVASFHELINFRRCDEHRRQVVGVWYGQHGQRVVLQIA